MNILSFLNRPKKSDKYNEEQTILRAAGVAYAILVHSSNLTDTISQESNNKKTEAFNELKPFTKQDLIEMDSIFSVALLMEAQKLFYERIIISGDKVRLFESKLFDFFSVLNKNIDVKSRTKDYVDYVLKIGEKGRLMYVGKKMSQCLGENGFVFQSFVNLLFGKYISETYIPSLVKVWQDGDKEINKIVNLSKIKLC